MDFTSKIKIGTLYDSVFRTMLNDCTQLIIPVVNEAFNESYTGNEEIILEQNEIFLRQQDNISEKITDTSFAIIVGDEPRHYHLECQSNDDNSMVVRMYEYDSQLAMRESRLEDGVLHVKFPLSSAISAAWQKYAGQLEDIHSYSGRHSFIRCANAQSTDVYH